MRFTVTLPHIHSWHARDWAADNCPSYLSCTIFGSYSVEGSYADYHFGDEADVIIFKLKWL